MWNPPTAKQLSRLPPLYATNEIAWHDKLIYEHFFLGGSDWYMAEYSPSKGLFFGFAILNADTENAEWGYASFDELRDLRIGPIEVDRDLHWRVQKASEIEKIVAAHQQRGGTA